MANSRRTITHVARTSKFLRLTQSIISYTSRNKRIFYVKDVDVFFVKVHLKDGVASKFPLVTLVKL